jgi:hypothetical protein
VSTDTAGEENTDAIILVAYSKSILAASSFGMSTLYIKCQPLPLQACTGSGHPILANHSIVAMAHSLDASSSASVDDMPAGRTGSKSSKNQRLLSISASEVVGSVIGKTRNVLFALAISDDLTGLTVV